MEIFATNDEGSVHFGRDDSSSEDSATDGDFAGERTLLVCSSRLALQAYKICLWRETALHADVCALDGSLWRPKAQPNIFKPSASAFSSFRTLGSLRFRVHKYVRLLLESPLGLYCQLGGHVCGESQRLLLDDMKGFPVWETGISRSRLR